MSKSCENLDLELLPDYSTLPKDKRTAIKDAYKAKGQFYCVEYVPKRGRANCRGCRRGFEVGALRARHLVCNNICFSVTSKSNASKKRKLDEHCGETGAHDICGRWHIECLLRFQAEKVSMFTHSHPDWKQVTIPTMFAGFTKIKKEDQELVNNLLTEASKSGGFVNRMSEASKSGSSVNKMSEASNSGNSVNNIADAVQDDNDKPTTKKKHKKSS